MFNCVERKFVIIALMFSQFSFKEKLYYKYHHQSRSASPPSAKSVYNYFPELRRECIYESLENDFKSITTSSSFIGSLKTFAQACRIFSTGDLKIAEADSQTPRHSALPKRSCLRSRSQRSCHFLGPRRNH
jgi:hypothetical protein